MMHHVLHVLDAPVILQMLKSWVQGAAFQAPDLNVCTNCESFWKQSLRQGIKRQHNRCCCRRFYRPKYNHICIL